MNDGLLRDGLVLLPLAISFVSAVVCLASTENNRRWLLAVAVLAHVALLATALLVLRITLAGEVLVHEFAGWSAPVGIVFAVDAFSAILLAISLVLFAAATAYLFLENSRFGSRPLAMMFLLEAGVAGALCTGDLFNFYVFFELLGITSFVLVAYQREGLQLEAAMKFAVLSLLASSLLLAGVGAIYAQTGRLTLAALYQPSMFPDSPSLYLFSVGLVLTALALKASLVPLHFWLPDAHSMAPTPVSVVLSGVVVKVGAYGIFRVLASHASWVGDEVRPVLLWAGAVTAVMAAVLAVGQRDLKRLLAYSTASQMGYVVAAGSLGSVAGMAGALVFIVAHSLTKGTLFIVAGTLILATGERRFEPMTGVLRRSPLFAAAALVAALSLAGLPPFAGFAGKLAVFRAVIVDEAWWTLAALLTASLLLVFLMARVWLGAFGGRSLKEPEEQPRIPPSKLTLTVVMAALVILVGLGAEPVFRASERAAEWLQDGTTYREAVLGSAAQKVVGNDALDVGGAEFDFEVADRTSFPDLDSEVADRASPTDFAFDSEVADRASSTDFAFDFEVADPASPPGIEERRSFQVFESHGLGPWAGSASIPSMTQALSVPWGSTAVQVSIETHGGSSQASTGRRRGGQGE